MEVTRRRTLSLFAAMVLMSIVAGILHAVVPSLPRLDMEDSGRICVPSGAEPESAMPSPLRARWVELTASGATAVAQLRVELAADSYLLSKLRDLASQPSISRGQELMRVARACVGEVRIEGAVPEYEQVTFERRQQEGLVLVTLSGQAKSLAEDHSRRWVWISVRSGEETEAAESHVKVQAGAGGVLPYENWPALLTSTTAEWPGALNGRGEVLEFMIMAQPSSKAASTPNRPSTARGLLEGLPWSFGAILVELVAAAPFILILVAASKSQLRSEPRWQVIAAVAACLLAFHVSCMFGYAIGDLASVAHIVRRKYERDWFLDLWGGAYATSSAIFFCILPVLFHRVRRWLQGHQPLDIGVAPARWQTLVLSVSAVIAVSACVVAAYYVGSDGILRRQYLSATSGLDGLLRQWPSWSLLEATAALIAFWMALEIWPKRQPLLFAVMLIGGVNLAVVGSSLALDKGMLETILVAVMAVPFAVCAVSLFHTAALKISGDQWHGLRGRWLQLVLVVASVGLVILLTQPRVENEVLESRLRNALYPFATLGVFCVLAFVLVVARDLGSNEDRQPDAPTVRILAAVLLIGFVIWPSREPNELVAALLVAGIMLRYWTFEAPSARSVSVDALRLAARAAVTRTLANEGLRGLRKAKVTELSEGKTTLHDSSTKLAELDAEMEAEASRLGRELRAGFAVLEWGPDPRAWSRGLLGAKYGAIVGSPWSTLFLVSSLQQPLLASDLNSVLAFVFSAMFSVTQWALVGFVFMYCFPHIRGQAGLQKGLVLFLSIVVPVLSGILLSSGFGEVELPKHLLWVCQLFAVCMLLGLFVGDYQVLRGAGLGWRQLLDLHQLGNIAAWGSSLLVAVGAAVAAAISTEAVGWLAQGVQLFNSAPSVPGVR